VAEAERRYSKSNIISFGFISFFNDTASEIIYPLLPLFLTSVLGVGPAILGVIEGLAETTASLLKFVSGYLSDKWRRRKVLLASGYTFSILLRPLVGVTTHWAQVLFIRFADRIGKGVRTSPRDALLADCVGEGKRGLAFGFQRAMDHAGAIVGSAVAVLLLGYFHLSLRTLFLVSFVPGLAAIWLCYFAVKEIQPKAITGAKMPFPLFPNVKGLGRNFLFYLLVVFLFTLGNSTDAFLLLRATDSGITAAAIPALWIVLHISKAVFSVPGGRLSDRLGRKGVIIFGWVIYAFVYLSFGLTRSIGWIWILFATYGLYFALSEGVEKALVADLVPSGKRGTAYGLYNLAVGIGALPASVIFGLVWKSWGAGTAFTLGAGLAMVAACLLLFVKTGSRRGGGNLKVSATLK
jgi:MFS family permease